MPYQLLAPARAQEVRRHLGPGTAEVPSHASAADQSPAQHIALRPLPALTSSRVRPQDYPRRQTANPAGAGSDRSADAADAPRSFSPADESPFLRHDPARGRRRTRPRCASPPDDGGYEHFPTISPRWALSCARCPGAKEIERGGRPVGIISAICPEKDDVSGPHGESAHGI